MNGIRQTVTEEDVLDFIVQFQRAFPGVSPSYREILIGLEMTSTGTVQNKIQRLSETGSLEVYREHVGFRGLLVPNLVIFAREDCQTKAEEELWDRLERLKHRSRMRVKGRLGE